MQIWAESGKSALPICNYSQILYQFLTFTQNLKRSRTDISTWDVEWKSSNPEKLIIMSTGGLSFQEVPPTSGSVTFTTKLGNETFSFVIDFNLCALPET